MLTARAPQAAKKIHTSSTGAGCTVSGVLITCFTLPTPSGDLDTLADALRQTCKGGDPAPTRGPDRTLDGIPGVTFVGPYGASMDWYLWAASLDNTLVTITFDSSDKTRSSTRSLIQSSPACSRHSELVESGRGQSPGTTWPCDTPRVGSCS